MWRPMNLQYGFQRFKISIFFSILLFFCCFHIDVSRVPYDATMSEWNDFRKLSRLTENFLILKKHENVKIIEMSTSTRFPSLEKNRNQIKMYFVKLHLMVFWFLFLKNYYKPYVVTNLHRFEVRLNAFTFLFHILQCDKEKCLFFWSLNSCEMCNVSVSGKVVFLKMSLNCLSHSCEKWNYESLRKYPEFENRKGMKEGKNVFIWRIVFLSVANIFLLLKLKWREKKTIIDVSKTDYCVLNV